MTLITKLEYEVSQDQSELIKKAIGYKLNSLSPNTWRTYKSMWKKFVNWCVCNSKKDKEGKETRNYLPATAETVARTTRDRPKQHARNRSFPNTCENRQRKGKAANSPPSWQW